MKHSTSSFDQSNHSLTNGRADHRAAVSFLKGFIRGK